MKIVKRITVILMAILLVVLVVGLLWKGASAFFRWVTIPATTQVSAPAAPAPKQEAAAPTTPDPTPAPKQESAPTPKQEPAPTPAPKQESAPTPKQEPAKLAMINAYVASVGVDTVSIGVGVNRPDVRVELYQDSVLVKTLHSGSGVETIEVSGLAPEKNYDFVVSVTAAGETVTSARLRATTSPKPAEKPAEPPKTPTTPTPAPKAEPVAPPYAVAASGNSSHVAPYWDYMGEWQLVVNLTSQWGGDKALPLGTTVGAKVRPLNCPNCAWVSKTMRNGWSGSSGNLTFPLSELGGKKAYEVVPFLIKDGATYEGRTTISES